jgi:hypothetical protein
MSVAHRKEIRLLLPAWILALTAATVPVWVLGSDIQSMEQIYFILFAAGALLLSLSSFGLEMSFGTFPSLLAQPRPRLDTWQIKVGILAAALAIVVMVACFSWWLRVQTILAGAMYLAPNYVYYLDHSWPVLFRRLLLLTAMAFAGGLWTTLLFRQIVTAFWFALLVPMVLYSASWSLFELLAEEDDHSFILAAIGLASCVYVAASYYLAQWLFLHAQVKQTQEAADPVAWSFLPAFPKPRWPVAALLVKELRLHQGTLLICVGLVLFHLAAVAVADYFPSLELKEYSLREFWMVWMVVPLVVGCASFAEERRAQTLQIAHCLPIRLIIQFFIKLLAVFGLGIFLGAVIPWSLEQLRSAVESDHPTITGMLIAATIITAIGCYASSLSAALLQAIGAAIASTISVFVLFIVVVELFHFNDRAIGEALPHLFWPAFIVTCLFLSYFNFKQLRVTWRLWLRNGLILTAVVYSLFAMATYIYT